MATVAAKASHATRRRESTEKGSIDNSTCVICIGPVVAPVEISCGHAYCKACLDELRAKGVAQTCPLCREELPPGRDGLFDLASHTSTLSRIYGPMKRGEMSTPLPPAAHADFDGAVAMLTEASAQGHLPARLQLALLYKRGVGVEKDEKRHFTLLSQAANEGLALAQANLGYAYRDGVGCKQSYELAVACWEKSVSGPTILPSVYTDIGYAYQEGLGVQQNFKHAADLFKRGADHRDAGAMNNLARCYRAGEGVRNSFAEARRLYQLAHKTIPMVIENIRGLEDDITKRCPLLGERVILYDLVSAVSLNGSFGTAVDFGYELGPDQPWIEGKTGFTARYTVRLDGSRRRLINAKLQNVGPGHADNQLQIAISFRDGSVVEKSPEKAAKWFAMAASQDDERALYELALAYSKGSGVEQSDIRAIELLERSAAKGHAKAADLLRSFDATGRT